MRVALAVGLALAAAAPAAAQPGATSVRLTSPLGRTGMSGTIRVVAQVATPVPGGVVPVRFFVDDRLLGEDTDGPPYVAEWEDDNPYERREIRVEVDDGAGGVARDRVELAPLDVVEEAHVASVLVEALVTDPQGRPVATLAADDFTLFENGAPQTLDLVQLQRMPTHFTLLMDSSQSMARRVDFVRATARRLVGRLRPNDTVVVAPFKRTVDVATGPTNDDATIAEAIAAIRPSGGTAIRDALAHLPAAFARADSAARHVIVLVTDGYDEHSETPLDEALDALGRLRATVYVVGIGGVAGISLRGELLLRRIAAATGGRAYFPTREDQLPDVHDKIVSDVFSRYLITYTPTNQEPDGSYRAIRLTTPDTEHRIMARAGYYAPQPPPVRPTLEFSATLAGGQDGAVLSAGDLTINEDGVRQTIESFHEANGPLSIVLALDASGSMKGALDAVKQAAVSFVEALRPADPLALLQFADDVVLAHDFSTLRPWSVDTIQSHQARGGTALWDALHDAAALLERRDARRAVVVLTDGRDENNPGTAPGSVHTLADVLAALQRADTTVYAIGLGPKVDRPALERIAAVSGGAAFFPADVSALAEQYRRVIDDLRRRYVVTYTSTNHTRDGAWRTVVIGSPRPDLVIRSRGGYHAPASAAAPAPQSK